MTIRIGIPRGAAHPISVISHLTMLLNVFDHSSIPCKQLHPVDPLRPLAYLTSFLVPDIPARAFVHRSRSLAAGAGSWKPPDVSVRRTTLANRVGHIDNTPRAHWERTLARVSLEQICPLPNVPRILLQRPGVRTGGFLGRGGGSHAERDGRMQLRGKLAVSVNGSLREQGERDLHIPVLRIILGAFQRIQVHPPAILDPIHAVIPGE